MRQNPAVIKGRINLTCDAWQASNIDGYFAVTGAWIEETSPHAWALRTSLLGFIQLNNAHNGVHLGQALFKVVQCTGISHKIRDTLYLPAILPFDCLFLDWVCHL
jgi:hypothetical protein